MRERRQQAPDAGDTGDGKAETIGSSQGGAVDASSTPAGSAESETKGSSQWGVVNASSAPTGSAESKTRGSSQESAPAERGERDLNAASTPGMDQGDVEDLPAVLSRREARKPSDTEAPPRDRAGVDPGSEPVPGG